MSTTEQGAVQGPCFPPEIFEKVLSYIVEPTTDDISSEHQCRRDYWLPLSNVCWHFRGVMLPKLFDTITIMKAFVLDHRSEQTPADVTCPSTVSFCRAVVEGDDVAVRLAGFVGTCTVVLFPSTEKEKQHGDSATKQPGLNLYTDAIARMHHLRSIFIHNAFHDVGVSMLDVVPNILQRLESNAFPEVSTISITDGDSAERFLYDRSPEELGRLETKLASSVTQLHLVPSGSFLFRERSTLSHAGSSTVQLFKNLRSVCLASYLARSFMEMVIETPAAGAQLEEVEFDALPATAVSMLVDFLAITHQLTALRLHPDHETRFGDFQRLDRKTLSRLSTLLCPLAYFQFLLPGRPVQDLAFGCGHSGSIVQQVLAAPQQILPEVLSSLSSTSVPIKVLRIDGGGYRRLFTPSTLTADTPVELELSSLVLYNFQDFVWGHVHFGDYDRGGPIGDMTIAKAMFMLSCPQSINIPHLRVEYLTNAWWDLSRQHAIVSTHIPSAFPAATRVQIAEWIEWRKGKQGNWTPVLYAETDRKSVV